MRVVVLSNRYLDRTGGAEAVAAVGIEGLEARGHHVSVITLPEAGPHRGFVRGRKSEGSLHRLTPDNLYHPRQAARWPLPLRAVWHLRDLFARRNQRHVAAILAEERPDVVLSHNLKGMGLRTALAVRSARVPHAHVLHDLQLSVPSGTLDLGRERRGEAAPWLRASYERGTRACLGSPALVLSPSRYLLDEHQRRGFFPQSQLEVLPLPRPVPTTLARPSGPAQVLFAGQLAPHKGVRVLLAAWRRHDRTAATLLLAGDGPLRAEVAAAATADPTIVCCGRLSGPELQARYAHTDIVVVPSTCYEGAGLSACEGQAHGAFVVASGLGGLPEYVAQGGGMLVTAGDADALAAALERAVAGVEDLRSRRAAIAAAAPGLTLTAYVDRLEAALYRIAGARPRAASDAHGSGDG